MLWCIRAEHRLALRALQGGHSFQRAHGLSRFPPHGSSVYLTVMKFPRPKGVFSNFP